MKCGKIIGIGNTATVYEWGKDKVIKLFHQDYPKDAIEKEFFNSIAIRNMNFEKPNAYEIIACKERIGIIYDRINGESLQDWVLKTGDVQECAVYMASLHKLIIKNKIEGIPSYKDFLKFHISKAPSINLKQQKEVFVDIDLLPDGDTLCHGDFHPGNIIISNGRVITIDFMNICKGNLLYDIARTVFLLEYTPVPVEAGNWEELLNFKKVLADLYLKQMKVSRDMIQNYLTIIILARKGECPNEKSVFTK